MSLRFKQIHKNFLKILKLYSIPMFENVALLHHSGKASYATVID